MATPHSDECAKLERLVVPLWPDAGQALGLSRNCTYDSAKRGEIPTVRFGRVLRVPIVALRRMVEGFEQKPRSGGKAA
jgi:hypothetical protein